MCATLRKYAPVWVNTHFNHPKELTPAAREACGRLLDHGIPMGNQTVLLKGINSSPRTLKALFQQLVATRVWPYYLYQCDLVARKSPNVSRTARCLKWLMCATNPTVTA